MYWYRFSYHESRTASWSDVYSEEHIKSSAPLPLVALRSIARVRERNRRMLTATLMGTNDPTLEHCCPLRLAAWTDEPYGPHPSLSKALRTVEAAAMSGKSLEPGQTDTLREYLEKAVEEFKRERSPEIPSKTKKANS